MHEGKVLTQTDALEKFPWIQTVIKANPILGYQNLDSVLMIEAFSRVHEIEDLMNVIPCAYCWYRKVGFRPVLVDKVHLIAFSISRRNQVFVLDFAITTREQFLKTAQPIGQQLRMATPKYIVLHQLSQEPKWQNIMFIYTLPPREALG